jgi:hypothetical protein
MGGLPVLPDRVRSSLWREAVELAASRPSEREAAHDSVTRGCSCRHRLSKNRLIYTGRDHLADGCIGQRAVRHPVAICYTRPTP